jgi:hypothetical protein
MTHAEILQERKRLLDDLRTRDPESYREQEKRERMENMRLGFKVAMSPPGHVRRAERMS